MASFMMWPFGTKGFCLEEFVTSVQDCARETVRQHMSATVCPFRVLLTGQAIGLCVVTCEHLGHQIQDAFSGGGLRSRMQLESLVFI